MRSMWKWAFGLGAALSFTGALSAGCGSSGGGTGAGGGTSAGGGGSPSCSGDLASIQQTIFKPTCATAGCHTTADAPNAGDLDLSGDAAGVLVGVPSATCPQQIRVVPGSPSTSFLFQKLVAAQPTCGASMPLGKSLTDEQKSCISQWITSLPPGGTGGAGGSGGTSGSGGGAVDAGSDAMGCEQCGGSDCIALSSDPQHCGACSTVCPTGQLCANGKCASDCGSLVQCGNTCCPAGMSCSGGQCVCPAGTSACNGTCIDTQTDANNCGSCGNACAVGQTCNGGSCTCGAASVSFAGAVQPIFTNHCTSAGCHGGVMPAGNLSLKSGQSFGNLVDVLASQCNDGRKRVLPGQPATSYVIQKMMGMNLCFGTKMPKTGGITSAEIETVADWICAGAPNN